MKTEYFGSEHGRSGVDITFTKSNGNLNIGGWYDGCVGIKSTNITIAEFFKRVGITEDDCKKAFNKGKRTT
jgi:hypothetical protein